MPVFISLRAVDFGYHSDGWWLLALPQEEDGHVCPVTLIQSDCLASSPVASESSKKVSLPDSAPSSTDATPQENNTCLRRYLGAPVSWHKVGMGLFVYIAPPWPQRPLR